MHIPSSHWQAFENSCDLLVMLEGSDGGMITQIHATLDDVGNCKKDGMNAVAGYAAYSAAWKRFNYRWMISLQQLGEPYLHTANYLNRFWLSDNTITDDDICLILAPFIEAVKGALLSEGAVPICVITECSAYDNLTTSEKKYIRPPAEHSFEIAVRLASKAIRSPFHISNTVSIQMDESDNAPKLYDRYRMLKAESEELRNHLSSLCFCDDRKHPPVQAADMLANVVLKTWRNMGSDGNVPRAYQELTIQRDRTLPGTYIHFDHERLRNLADFRRQKKERMAFLE